VTDIDIVNMALGQVGVGRINSLSDLSNEAKVANDHYATVRDALLEERMWTFATFREQLAQDATPPVFHYANRFVIPSLVLKVWECYDSSDGDEPIDDWAREGQFVATDEGQVWAVTTHRVNEAVFSPSFTNALSTRLGAVLAIPLAENRQLFSDLMSLSDTLLKIAAGSDGQQGRTKATRAPRLPGRRPTL
jgi:hypothetical protein